MAATYKIDKETLHLLYLEWVDKICEECEWKTTFGPEEIVHAIGSILEENPQLIQNVKS
jgi:hypothetical protein